jgi:hypothetical protein
MSVCVCHVGSKRNGDGVTVVSDSQGGRGEDNDPRSTIRDPAIRVYVTQKEEARKDRQTDPVIPVDWDLKRKEEGLENGKVVVELRVVF